MTRRKVVGAVLVATLLATMAGVAVGTPGSGVTVTPLAAGRIDNKVEIQQGAGESTVVARFVFDPGGTTGWHSHPGKTVVLVTAGRFTLYRDRNGDCETRTYRAGEGFVEPPSSVHVGVNEGDVPARVTAVFFRVPADGTVRFDKPDPGVC